MDLQLDSTVALVTAASRGLGYATAWEMAREGANIVLCSRNRSDVEAAANRIVDHFDVEVLPKVADVDGNMP